MFELELKLNIDTCFFTSTVSLTTQAIQPYVNDKISDLHHHHHHRRAKEDISCQFRFVSRNIIFHGFVQKNLNMKIKKERKKESLLGLLVVECGKMKEKER